MNIVLFGAPGAGKGTQSELLVKNRNMVHISTGDLFRAAIKNKTELGVKAQEYLDRGNLVPDEITIGLVKETLFNIKKDFILDGFPRNVNQAQKLEELLQEMNLSIDKAFFLEVERDILISRLTGRRLCRQCGSVYHVETKNPKSEGKCDSCGGELYQRIDDKLEVIDSRLRVYDDYTAPLKDYYQNLGKFVGIDGEKDPSLVFQEINIKI